MIGGPGRAAGQIVDGHVAVVEPHRQDVGVAGVDVHTEDTRAGRADVLGVGGVLQGEQAEVALPTFLVEIVRAVAHSKQIPIFRIPLEVRDLQSLRFVIEALLQVRVNIFKCPEWQQSSLSVLVLVSRVFIEPVVPGQLTEPQITSLLSHITRTI